MFERYTEKARRAIFFARYEASQYGSTHIDVEHLLLGVLREDRSVARKVLRAKGGEQSVRDEIERHITRGERISTSVEVPLSAECMRILNYAAEEAERLGDKNVDTAHFLLGILREKNSFAAQVLRERGLALDWLREELSRPAVEKEPNLSGEVFSLSQLADSWGSGKAAEFARMFAPEGQFVDPVGDLWVGPARISEVAKLIFAAPGWAKSKGKIEDVQFVGGKAMMATLSWEPLEKVDTPNPGCVRMTVILMQKSEGWVIVRVQAIGFQPKSQSAAG